jgi:threonine dehydratase
VISLDHTAIQNSPVSLEEILAAKAYAGESFSFKQGEPAIRKTPLWYSSFFSTLTGREIYLKCEHLQRSGSFKARGAWNWLFNHKESGQQVVSCSTVNHNMALAWASARMNMPCRLFFRGPLSQDISSFLDATGAQWSQSNQPAEECNVFLQERSALLYQPVGNNEVLAGYATVFLEVLEALEWFEEIWVPVNHGDLLYAASIVMQALRPAMKIVACLGPDQTEDDLKKPGRWKTMSFVNTVSCSHSSLNEARSLLATREKQIVEPMGTLALAAFLEQHGTGQGKAVILLTGGNQPHISPGASGV